MKYKITYAMGDIASGEPDTEIIEAQNAVSGQGGTVEFWDEGSQTVMIISPDFYIKVELIKEPSIAEYAEMIKDQDLAVRDPFDSDPGDDEIRAREEAS